MKTTCLALLTGWLPCNWFSTVSSKVFYGMEKTLVFLAALPADNLFAQKGIGTFLRAAIVFVLGFIHLFFPKQMWDWECGHLFKDKQPTQSSLLGYRICGGIAIVISVIIFLRG